MVEDEAGIRAIRGEHEFDYRIVARAPAAGTPTLDQSLITEHLQIATGDVSANKVNGPPTSRLIESAWRPLP